MSDDVAPDTRAPGHINVYVLLDALMPAIKSNEALNCRQLFVLALLKAEHRQDEPTDFQVLVTKMKIRKPSITRALDALEQMGYVWRTKFEDDRRRAYVTLTVKGHEFIEQVLG